jgi:hypothetical protein
MTFYAPLSKGPSVLILPALAGLNTLRRTLKLCLGLTERMNTKVSLGRLEGNSWHAASETERTGLWFQLHHLWVGAEGKWEPG